MENISMSAVCNKHTHYALFLVSLLPQNDNMSSKRTVQASFRCVALETTPWRPTLRNLHWSRLRVGWRAGQADRMTLSPRASKHSAPAGPHRTSPWELSSQCWRKHGIRVWLWLVTLSLRWHLWSNPIGWLTAWRHRGISSAIGRLFRTEFSSPSDICVLPFSKFLSAGHQDCELWPH